MSEIILKWYLIWLIKMLNAHPSDTDSSTPINTYTRTHSYFVRRHSKYSIQTCRLCANDATNINNICYVTDTSEWNFQFNFRSELNKNNSKNNMHNTIRWEIHLLEMKLCINNSKICVLRSEVPWCVYTNSETVFCLFVYSQTFHCIQHLVFRYVACENTE